ncbi:copper chaperone PCu(A)C [Rhizobium helianthi]|uniref:Copper chaperone PCu(A)C n=1 Tax=Rhizobium helianthi TaxID=1132695 RepID=A0ABW4M7N0_9HYPH
MKTKILGLLLALLAFAGFNPAYAHGFKVGDLEIGHPYSRAMLPGAKVGGGYLKITNKGGDDRLVSVTTERAASAQIHEMQLNDNVMVMRELKEGLPVPANSTVELKPGSYHIMFMNVTEPFKEGEMIKARLVFEKAGPVDVEFAVGPANGGAKTNAQPAHEHGAHEHEGMDHGSMGHKP